MKIFSVLFGLILFFLSCFLLSCTNNKPDILYDRIVSIEPGDIIAWEFNVMKDHTVTLDLISSDPYPVDVYIMEVNQVKNYQWGKKFNFIRPFSILSNHKASLTGKLNKGSYAVTIVNGKSIKGIEGSISSHATKAHIKVYRP